MGTDLGSVPGVISVRCQRKGRVAMSDVADRLAVVLEQAAGIAVDGLSPAAGSARFDVSFLASPARGDHRPTDGVHLLWRPEQKPSSS